MSKRIVPVLALLALLPVALQAQTAEDRIDAAMDRAQGAGIPLELLETKIAEGHAKGMAMDRIAFAVEWRTDALVAARAVMARDGRQLSKDDLSAGADALGAGISEAALSAVSDAPANRRAVAIAVLTELVGMGKSVETALARVQQVLERDPEALASLPGQAAGRATGARNGRGLPAGVGPAVGGPAGAPAGIPAPGQRPGAASPGKPEGAGPPGG